MAGVRSLKRTKSEKKTYTEIDVCVRITSISTSSLLNQPISYEHDQDCMIQNRSNRKIPVAKYLKPCFIKFLIYFMTKKKDQQKKRIAHVVKFSFSFVLFLKNCGQKTKHM